MIEVSEKRCFMNIFQKQSSLEINFETMELSFEDASKNTQFVPLKDYEIISISRLPRGKHEEEQETYRIEGIFNGRGLNLVGISSMVVGYFITNTTQFISLKSVDKACLNVSEDQTLFHREMSEMQTPLKVTKKIVRDNKRSYSENPSMPKDVIQSAGEPFLGTPPDKGKKRKHFLEPEAQIKENAPSFNQVNCISFGNNTFGKLESVQEHDGENNKSGESQAILLKKIPKESSSKFDRSRSLIKIKNDEEGLLNFKNLNVNLKIGGPPNSGETVSPQKPPAKNMPKRSGSMKMKPRNMLFNPEETPPISPFKKEKKKSTVSSIEIKSSKGTSLLTYSAVPDMFFQRIHQSDYAMSSGENSNGKMLQPKSNSEIFVKHVFGPMFNAGIPIPKPPPDSDFTLKSAHSNNSEVSKYYTNLVDNGYKALWDCEFKKFAGMGGFLERDITYLIPKFEATFISYQVTGKKAFYGDMLDLLKQMNVSVEHKMENIQPKLPSVSSIELSLHRTRAAVFELFIQLHSDFLQNSQYFYSAQKALSNLFEMYMKNQRDFQSIIHRSSNYYLLHFLMAVRSCLPALVPKNFSSTLLISFEEASFFQVIFFS